MRPIDLDTYGTLDRDHYCYTLTEVGSRRWGAYEADGVDSPEAVDFRSDVRAQLRVAAAELGGAIEVFALGAPMDAQDWALGLIEPPDDDDDAEETTYQIAWSGAPTSEVNDWLVYAAPTTGTLREVCELCAQHGVKARLSDAAGWPRWWVSASGDFRAA